MQVLWSNGELAPRVPLRVTRQHIEQGRGIFGDGLVATQAETVVAIGETFERGVYALQLELAALLGRPAPELPKRVLGEDIPVPLEVVVEKDQVVDLDVELVGGVDLLQESPTLILASEAQEREP